MAEMFSWYIDNNNYFTEDFTRRILAYAVEASSAECSIADINKLHNPTVGNKAAAVTAARDFGLLNGDDFSDEAIMFYRGFYPFGDLVIDLMSKRNVSKSVDIPLKPIVILAMCFTKMRALNVPAQERFLTAAECFEYLSVMESYGDLTDDLVLSIVDNRIYPEGPSAKHVPIDRVTVKNKVLLMEIFSAFASTKLFYKGDSSNSLYSVDKYWELLAYIAENGQAMTNAPTATRSDNVALSLYMSNIQNGLLEIIPEISFIKCPETGLTRKLYECLFGINAHGEINWKEYSTNEIFGRYRIFYPISKLVFAKIYLQNKVLAEHLTDYENQTDYYRDALKEDRLVIEIPFENGNHTSIEELETISATDQKERFKTWMKTQKKANGEYYSINTINSYISQMENGYQKFEKFHEYDSVFQIQDPTELRDYMEYLFNVPEFDGFNESAGNRACSCGLNKYMEYISIETIESISPVYATTIETHDYPWNRIIFGAPGTGKSFELKKDAEHFLKDTTGTMERVTFYPDYTYSQFVGSYKPVSEGDTISYKFVPGPFMRVFVDAIKSGRSDAPQPHILIIEEINRAKVAAVFGDIFQLLDRDDDGVSEYDIQTSEDIRKYLAKELGGNITEYSRIRIPNNMFIWATMNSADQGVFPMDTAFKRRWNFEYLGINEKEAEIRGRLMLGTDIIQDVEWNALRRAINEKLAKEYKVNEDKLMGPFFLSKKVLRTISPDDDTIADTDRFIEVFKSKVIMYLYEDAARQHKNRLFSGCEDTTKYSAVCECFDRIGIQIFGEDFEEAYYNPQKG